MKRSKALIFFLLLACIRTSYAAFYTNAAEVANAFAEHLAPGVRFELDGQVINAPDDPKLPLTLKDDSGFVHVYLADDIDRPPAAGDWISVQGLTAPIVEDTLMAYATSLTVVSHGTVPPPVDVTYDDIYSGKFAYGIVRLRGVVIDAFQDEADSRYAFLILFMNGMTIGLPSGSVPIERLERLIGAEISVVGPCSAYCGRGPRSKLEYEVYIEHENDITILTPPPADPFDVQEFKDSVYAITFPSSGKMMRRKISGRVEAISDNQTVYLRTPDNGLSSVHLRPDVSQPKLGASIEAVGIAETDFYTFNLSRAIWRDAVKPVEIVDPPVPTLSVKNIFHDPRRGSQFNNALIGHVIKVQSEIAYLDHRPNGQGIIHLRDGDHHLIVDGSAVPHALKALTVGCTVEVTGLCVARTENWRPQAPFPHIYEMRLVLRTAEDVNIIARPPWWTPARLWFAILILASAILVFIAYSAVLTRIVRRRNDELNRERQTHERTEIRRLERIRLAIELHDSLVQTLTGTAMEVEAAREVSAVDPAAMSDHLRIAEKALQSCRSELRNSIWDLRSDTLEAETLEEAIRRTLTPHVNKARVAIKFSVRRDILADSICHAVIKIVRELTLNATNHGHARLVRIAGTIEAGDLRISVIDDGTGFDLNRHPGVREGHFGLQGVKERVNTLGGTFSIDSSPGNGTKIRVTIPTGSSIT